MLTKAQLRWSGHIVRMGDERLPKRLLYGELVEGKRSAGGQRKRYKDRLKVSLNKFSIDTDTWEDAATDRPEWRSLIAEGAINFEQQRLTGAEEKRRQRKSFSISSSSSYVCADCGRTFRAAIGLFSHKRTHRGSVDFLTTRDFGWGVSWSSSSGWTNLQVVVNAILCKLYKRKSRKKLHRRLCVTNGVG